ncbi:ribonuclease Oy-like [Saccostrea echinata]|uniref:ribonuclease Oy-like n=1 Tax=Saccostrea echinata TaxID=191078 RepID=UPI002A7F1190|nr:ribonuclease Oy-like [Saccostrea echinata]
MLLLIERVCFGEKEWDLFVLSMTWPATLCKFSKLYNKDHQRCITSDMWEIHGLWPSLSNGARSPEYCNISHSFSPDEIRDILSKLEKYWADELPGKNKYQFWKHEWEKHGRCATVVKATGTELKYFNTTIALRLKYDVDRMLSSADIKPGRSYKLLDIKKAVSRKTGAMPRVLCGIYKRKAWISQLQICMNKDFKVTNCPSPKSSSEADYPDNKKKTLPPSDRCFDMVFYTEKVNTS